MKYNKKNNNLFYNIDVVLLVINTIYVAIGCEMNIDLFWSLLVEMLLFMVFFIGWIKSLKQNSAKRINKQLYIVIVILSIYMLGNIIIYRTGYVFEGFLAILKTIIELIIFVIVIIYIIGCKDELQGTESQEKRLKIEKSFKWIETIIIMVWYVFKWVN